jgi:hypothetical protein
MSLSSRKVKRNSRLQVHVFGHMIGQFEPSAFEIRATLLAAAPHTALLTSSRFLAPTVLSSIKATINAKWASSALFRTPAP